MNYCAVLFDMDGVIIDSEPLHVAAFQAVLQQYGHQLSEEEYKEYFAGQTDKSGFQRYFTAHDAKLDLHTVMDEKAKAYLRLAAGELTPYPRILDFISGLVEKRVPIGLVTSSLRAEADAVLNTFHLQNHFNVVVTAEDITESKPSPQGYLKAASVLKVDPSQCIVIEDAPSGVMAAKAAGMHCVAITNTHSEDELGEATLVVHELTLNDLDSI